MSSRPLRALQSPGYLAQQVPGEIIRFTRYGTMAVSTLAGCMGLFMLTLACGLVFMLITGVGKPDAWLGGVLACAGFAIIAAFMFWLARFIYSLRQRLILGTDRLQYWQRRQLLWELPYDAIEKVDLIDLVDFFGKSSRFVALRLKETIRFEAPAWRDGLGYFERRNWALIMQGLIAEREWARHSTGYDILLPTQPASEPAERFLETLLTCWQRWQASQEV